MEIELIFFVVGGFFCFLNIYTSFLRYPLHLLRGGARKEYKWVSGAPLIGSLLMGLSLLELHTDPRYFIPGVILVVLDTGGIHWFLGVLLFHSMRKKSA